MLNIKVHAWINTYLIWSAETPPKDNNHIYYIFPEWIDRPRNELDNSLSGNRVFLSPNNPEVNLYLEKIVKELIANYPTIDGIHFDYIRLQDNNYGFNDIGLTFFAEKNKFNPSNIISNFNIKFCICLS